METQTRYDLNAAVENWRAELAAQTGLTAEVRRELETHLRDAITGFQQRGLNNEESFWLARKRVGQPPELGEEFGKADPAKIWRERAFWNVLVLSAFQLWNKACPYALGKITLLHFTAPTTLHGVHLFGISMACYWQSHFKPSFTCCQFSASSFFSQKAE
jgi:hypothetical protein